MSEAETCEGCRFDGAEYDVSDALGTLRAVPAMWEQLTEGLPDHVLEARPAPEVWSAAEYLAHSVGATKVLGVLLHRAGRGGTPPEAKVADLVQPPPRTTSVAESLEAMDTEMGRLVRAAQALGEDGAPAWGSPVDFAGTTRDAGWVMRHAVHETTHHLQDAGRGMHLLGAGAPTQQGSVMRVSSSDGGVPKAAVDVAEVGRRGLVGDRQADRRNHGRPLQALCLWSLEVIQALNAEGHPVQPGDAGENITVTGIDWPTLRTGVQFLVGDMLAEVSAFATPCSKNAAWFEDRYFNRMDHGRHPGWSRVYAWVREPGTVRLGDPVIVEP
jgi:MOSC domain-containing protein YiiM